MERVLFSLHTKTSTFALRNTSARTRSFLEHGVLLVAVLGFGLLILSHLSFVYRGGEDAGRQSGQIPTSCLKNIPGFNGDTDVTHILLSEETSSSATYTTSVGDLGILLSFSKTRGFLMLSEEDRYLHNITAQVVAVSKADPNCFGEPFLQAIVTNVVGPETVIINWLLGFYEDQGYIYNPSTRDMIELNSASSDSLLLRHAYHRFVYKAGVILTSLFLFFITTTLISFTLRETQDRMLEFTFQLQARIRAGLPFMQLIVTHVVESLVFVPVMVGMMFFLIEFYRGDKFLGFLVLSLVWVCEVFSVISIRTTAGTHFFPRIFFLLFTLFHVYFFSFPFGFSYTCFASTTCFVMHSMLFFWNRFELPAVAHGIVTVDNPRVGTPTRVGASTAPRLQQPIIEQPSLDSQDSAPNLPLTMRRQISGHSLPTVSSGGRNGLFNSGDDGDESYMYFMGGEVVMHREPSMSSPSGSLGRRDSLGSLTEAGAEASSAGVPTNIVAEVETATRIQESESAASLAPVEGSSLRRRRNPTIETDFLRASPPDIVREQGHDNLTPRWGNRDTEHSSGRIGSAPKFPTFPQPR